MFCFPYLRKLFSLFSSAIYILEKFCKVYLYEQRWNNYFIFLPYTSKIWKLLVLFLFFWQYNYLHKFNKNLLFFNMTQLEKLVILPRLWLECRIWEYARNYIWPDNFKELRLTLWSQWSPLEKVAWYLAYRIPSGFTRWVTKVTSWQVQKSQDIWGT